jgi:plasmid replication initiation protein
MNEKKNNLAMDVTKNLIEKSNALILSKNNSLTKRELIILDLYLSFIQPRDEGSRTIVVKKKLLEQAVGTQIKAGDLKQNISNLLKTQISIENEKGEWIQSTLFQSSYCFMDENKEWCVSLTCSDFAKNYMFDINQYTVFQLRDVINLKNSKSILLFEYLLSQKYMHKTWQISIDELRQQLNCTEEYYDDYRKFNSKILKPCVDDINKTSVLFNVEYSKKTDKDRFTTSIEFTLTNSKNYKQMVKDIHNLQDMENKKNNLLGDIL